MSLATLERDHQATKSALSQKAEMRRIQREDLERRVRIYVARYTDETKTEVCRRFKIDRGRLNEILMGEWVGATR